MNDRYNTDRMMTVASALEEGIEVSFADGRSGLIPIAHVPEITKTGALSSIELPNPYEMVLETVAGERIEVPWDFARHYCDESYRPRIEAIAAYDRQTLGGRVRDLREAAGLTQDALARTAGVGRITLVRLENGEQSPRLKTLNAVALALGRNVRELLTEPESI